MLRKLLNEKRLGSPVPAFSGGEEEKSPFTLLMMPLYEQLVYLA